MAKPSRLVSPFMRTEPLARSASRSSWDHGRVSSNPTALLVESDAACAAHLHPVLETVGFLVVRVGTLRAAWGAVCSGQRFSLVVVGMILPDGEGLALLPCIHARLPAARVVVTGTGMPDLAPGVDFIPRPFGQGRVEAALGLRRLDC